jgi:hypothetical protein
MMRASTLCLAVLLAGCSSSSSSTPVDAGNDVSVKPHDAGHDAKDAATHHDAGTVCNPVPVEDAGVDGATDAKARDAESDVKDDATDAGAAMATDADAGPIRCTLDTQCPTGDICDTKATGASAGTCVANTGATFCASVPADGGGAPGACSENASDMCCTATAGCIANPTAKLATANVCCPGAAGDTFCQGKLGDDTATCSGNICTTCVDTCIAANPAAYQKFLGYQLTDCGCTADGDCYAACHDSATRAPTSACGMCLVAQSKEGLSSTCTLSAAGDCSNDPACTTYQACAGMCAM